MRLVLAAILLVLAAPALAFEPGEKKEIEQIVRDYLLANPQILVEMQQAYEVKQQEQRAASAQKALKERREQVFASPYQTEMGNPEGDVTVVEFFDYNCPYCGRALEDMNVLLDADPNLRFVLKEVPIIRPESVGAHRISLAVYKIAPERYGEFHNRLFAIEGVKTDKAALQVAEELGLDRDKIIEAANADAVTQAFREGTELAEALGVTGTPSYVIGDELVFGAQGVDVLREKIANVRKCGKASCS